MCERTDAKGLRDKAILHLLYDLALRRSEVVGLDLEDVDLERGTLRILGKGRLQKEVLSLPTRTRGILSEWIRCRGELGGPLFINFHHDPNIQGKRLSPTSPTCACNNFAKWFFEGFLGYVFWRISVISRGVFSGVLR